MIWAMLGTAQIPIRLVFGLRVSIKQHTLRAAFARCASDEGVLAAEHKVRIVSKRAIRCRYGAVILLQAPLHLREERILQVTRIGELLFTEGIFGLKIFADLRIECAGVAHHLLPVFGPEPRIVIAQCHAVPFGKMGPACSVRRLEGRTSISLTVHE